MINAFFSKYFGLGVAAAIVLAFIFPYAAVSLHPLATVFLFAMMFLSGFTIEWDKLKDLRKYSREVILGNILIFVVIPFLMFLMAKTLLTNDLYIYGILFAALCPAAIIAPFFTGILKGDRELSFLILVSSSLISPFIIPPVLNFVAGDYLNISTTLLFKEILIFVPLPLVCAFLTKKYFKNADGFFTKSLPILNFVLLALLIFILFGVSMTKLDFNYIQLKELGIFLLIAFVQDFGFLLFLGPLNKSLQNTEKTVALFNSVSMKNIAIASTILLLYSPKAAIAPAMGFVAHAFLFTPLILRPLLRISLKN